MAMRFQGKRFITQISFFSFLPISWAVALPKAIPTLTCTHPEVCHMARLTLADSNAINFQMVPKHGGDIHHFDLDSQSMKTMLKSENLILPPLSQSPWSRNIELRRSSQNTLRLISPSPPSKYKNKVSTIAWEHFWPNPLTYCQIFQQLSKRIKIWYPQIQTTKDCPLQIASAVEKMASQTDERLFVLTHDSLVPLMLVLKKKYFVLKTSHQKENLSSKSLKKFLQEIRKHKKIVLLRESHLPIPKQLQSYIQTKTSQVIELETLRPFPSGQKREVLLNNIMKILEQKL